MTKASNDPVGKMVENRRLKMSQEDIDRAEPQDQYNCAIAETIKRVIPQAKRVAVNKERISFTLGEERISYPTPEAAIEAVIKPLDTGGKPEPITLQLVGGVANPVTHRSDEEIEKRRHEMRDYSKSIRTGQRPEPPSLAAKHGHFTGNSRTWNRFVDQEKRPETSE